MRALPDGAVALARVSVVAVRALLDGVVVLSVGAVRVLPDGAVILTRLPVAFVRNGVVVVALASVVCTGWRGGGGSLSFLYESCLTAWW